MLKFPQSHSSAHDVYLSQPLPPVNRVVIAWSIMASLLRSALASLALSAVAGSGPFRRQAGVSLPRRNAMGAATDLPPRGEIDATDLPPLGDIDTIAGDGTSGADGDGFPATSAELSAPGNVFVMTYRGAVPLGGIIISDTANNVVRYITPAGILDLLAGNYSAGYEGDGGQATLASLDGPQGICADSGGNVYIADSQNSVVRIVTPALEISLFAGDYTRDYGGDGGLASNAQLNEPFDCAVSPSGAVLISDYGNQRIVREGR